MSIRFRDDEDSTRSTIIGVVAGALAGIAIGMIVAQKFGGVEGIANRVRRRMPRNGTSQPVAAEEFEDYEDDDFDAADGDAVLENRVLEAFRNDPILCERAIDIGSLGDGVIELAGWVEDADEAHHAVTVAGGVPEVETVVNRLAVAEDEHRFADAARRTAAGDPSLTETHWEGHSVGVGRRAQGRSNELDRHADPKVDLQERWSSVEDGIKNAADDVRGVSAERRTKTSGKGSQVPRADHVDVSVEPPQAST